MLLVNDKSNSERCPRHRHILLWMLVNIGKRAVLVGPHHVMNEKARSEGIKAVEAIEEATLWSMYWSSGKYRRSCQKQCDTVDNSSAL